MGKDYKGPQLPISQEWEYPILVRADFYELDGDQEGIAEDADFPYSMRFSGIVNICLVTGVLFLDGFPGAVFSLMVVGCILSDGGIAFALLFLSTRIESALCIVHSYGSNDDC